MSSTVLVTGATGPHGRAVAEALLASGMRVRALTRDPASDRARALAALGAEPVAGDLADAASLTAALDGAPVVYAVTTPFGAGPDAEVAQGEGIIAAASHAHVQWLVLGSVASADQGTGVPHFESKWKIEQRLAASGVPHSVVAPSFFFENLGTPADKIAAGELSMPLSPDRSLQQLAAADLGALVAAVIQRRDALLGRRIEVAAEQLTPTQMAEALSQAGGRPIRYRRTDIDEIAARNADLAAMYRFLESTGYQVDIDGLRREFAEVPWTSFSDWVNRS